MRRTSASESNVPSREMTELIVTHKGELLHLKTKPTITVEKVVGLALQKFYGSTEDPDEFKLIAVSGRYILPKDRLVSQSGLKNNDALLLIRRRPAPVTENFPEDRNIGPTYDQILEATKDIEIRNSNRATPFECPSDFKSEMRKIFMSLAEVTALILSTNCKTDEIVSMLRNHLEAEPDPRSVRHLMAMGFTESAVKHALRINRLNKDEALDWLLEGNNAEINGSDDELGESSTSTSKCTPGSSKDASKSHPKKPSTQVNLTDYVTALIEKFRLFKRRDFRPNPRALQSLVEMGFEDEDEVKQALKITGNDQASACEWLTGERRLSLQDLDAGLDVESAVFKGILKNPEVQLSVNNPRMLLCFLNMIENPSSISRWLVDTETGPVIHQICRIYHTEKTST